MLLIVLLWPGALPVYHVTFLLFVCLLVFVIFGAYVYVHAFAVICVLSFGATVPLGHECKMIKYLISATLPCIFDIYYIC